MRRALFVLLFSTALGGAVVGACSATKVDTRKQEPGGEGGSGGGLGGDIGTGGEAGFGGGCVGDSFKADPVPLAMFIMQDQSNSMNDPAGNGLSRWDTIEDAITLFVQQPDMEGVSLGIQYFGQPVQLVPGCFQMPCVTDMDCTGGCSGCREISGVCEGPYNPDDDSCEPLDYTWAEIPIAPLPGVANDIIGSMGMHGPSTNTPTMPAITGAIDYAKAWQIAHPGEVTVVAFATDGGPGNCNIDLNDINDVIEAGFLGTPSIRTFVIGVGPLIAALDGFAAAGGTTSAFHVDTDVNATDNFVDTLNTIRGAALPCTYLIPPPPDGMTLDFNQVNVTVTPTNGPEQTIPKVEDAAHCPASGLAWYYNDNENPTQIILCDAACDDLAEDLTAEVNIVLGCLTVVM